MEAGQPHQRADAPPTARIRLEPPSEAYRDSFFPAMAEFAAEGNPQIPEGMTEEGFPAYVRRLHDQSVGKNLKPGYMPSQEFWIVDAEGYAGRIILGLAFTPSPDRLGHHVGYAVRPSRRRRGYATEALRLLLDEARRRGIRRLMPECAETNAASRKAIERNGGMPLDPIPGGPLRFLIDLDGGPTPSEGVPRTLLSSGGEGQG